MEHLNDIELPKELSRNIKTAIIKAQKTIKALEPDFRKKTNTYEQQILMAKN